MKSETGIELGEVTISELFLLQKVMAPKRKG